MKKRLIGVLFLLPVLPQLLFELMSEKTGRSLLRVIALRRVRTREQSEPDPKPFHVFWRDEKSYVVSEGTAGVAGALFWLSVLLVFAFILGS